VLIVPGNMDRRDVVLDLWREEGLHLLHRSTWTLRGHCFIGLGGMVARNPQRLGDPARFYHTDEEAYECLSRIWSEIHCTGRRIVIVHQPPRGAQDTLYTGESSGSTALRRFVDEHQPDLLLCGHIHECRGESWIGSCRIVNLGEMRLGYAAMIELEDGIRVEWIGPSGHIPKG
ncbi:MAG: metallophosphoesterase, partial [Methanothrix sp.]|nr:metallophosphoesterase [Methanothrix sp.]